MGCGAALEYTGGTWVELGVADDTPDLNAVDVRRFDAGLYGWMVGEEGFARQMRSGQWRDVPTPTDNPLLDVVTVSPDEAWAWDVTASSFTGARRLSLSPPVPS